MSVKKSQKKNWLGHVSRVDEKRWIKNIWMEPNRYQEMMLPERIIQSHKAMKNLEEVGLEKMSSRGKTKSQNIINIKSV